MKSCDLSIGAAKLELALKSLRTTLSAVEQQWNDETHRRFHEIHLSAIEPSTRNMFEAIARMAEVITAAEHECDSEH